MNLVILNRQRAKKINTRLLRQMLLTVLEKLKVTEAELGINLVNAREMARINWDFLQHTGSTDVITFDHSDPCQPQPKHGVALHGELFICVEDAVRQAREFGTQWQSELVRYAVHGVLHLLGYDDLKPELRRTMKREENRLVRWLQNSFLLAELAADSKMVT
jgi:probable rRNA maturation factor